LSASAETCTCNADDDFVWQSIDATSPPGAWDGCSPSADDDFVVQSGCRVVTTGDLRQDGVTPDTGLLVEPGGTFSAEVTQTTGPLELSLNANGLECRGTCNLLGGFRQFGAETPSIQLSLDAAGNLPAGNVVECAGWDPGAARWVPDCSGATTSPAGAADRIGLIYPAADFAGSQGLPFLTEAIAEIEPGDLLVAIDPEPADRYVCPEHMQFYTVTEASRATEDPAFVFLDPRQSGARQRSSTGNPDLGSGGFPLARRVVHAADLSRDVSLGDRLVAVPPDLITRDQQFVGFVVAFEDPASGLPRDRRYMIVDAFDCAASPAEPPCLGETDVDYLAFGDRRGVRGFEPRAGERLWVTRGFERRCSFGVVAPLRITSATAALVDDSPLVISGTASVRGVVLDEIGGVQIVGADAALPEWAFVMGVDLGASGNNRGQIEIEGASDVRITRTGMYGLVEGLVACDGDLDGDPEPCLNNHVFHHPGGASSIGASSIAYEDVTARYHSDDVFLGHNVDGLVATRVIAGPSQDDANTTNFAMIGGSRTRGLEFTDVACIACAGSAPIWSFNEIGEPAVVDRFLAWGGGESVVNKAHHGGLIARNFQVVGLRGALTAQLIPSDEMDRFVVRDARVTSENITPLMAGGPERDDVTNGYFQNVVVSGGFGANLDEDFHLENVGVFDVQTTSPQCASSGGCSLLRQPTAPSTLAVDRLTIAYRQGLETTFNDGYRFSGFPATGTAVFDGVLIAGLKSDTLEPHAIAASVGRVAALTIHSGPCFWDNSVDGTPNLLAELPATTLRGVFPGFVDPTAGRFDVLPGSAADLAACGIRGGQEAPGLTVWSPAIHGITRSEIECMADGCREGAFGPCEDGVDNDADGLIDSPEDPGCLAFWWRAEDPECNDGIENDDDGLVDLDDPECFAAWDASEGYGRCGLGFEIAAPMTLLALCGRRRRRLGGRRRPLPLA
jgi:hypothetical protein